MRSAALASIVSRALVVPPRATLRFRLLREGEVTSGPKTLRIFRGWDSVVKLEMVFHADEGEWTQAQSFDLATLLAQGEWLAVGVDQEAPRKTRAVYLSFTESAELTYNITSGEGGGSGGDPATLAASVRVDQQLVSREVIVLEKPSDGIWRVAGYGPTPEGLGALDLRVTDGIFYAVAVDDWGVTFQPSLAVTVGQTVRPTTYAGWLYRITEAGALPETEPVWWPIDGENAPRDLGTARAVAVRYYRPLAHGPIPVEVS